MAAAAAPRVNYDGLLSLAWSLGVNAAFGLSFLAFFGLLRRSTARATKWYAPRRHFPLLQPELHGGRLPLPAEPATGLGWLPALMSVTEDALLAQAGLDAVVFLRLFRLCARLFSLLSLLLVPSLVPLFWTSAGAPPDAHGEVPWTTACSLGNVPRGSPRLWWPLAAAYLTTALTLAALRGEYKHIAGLRLRELCSREATPEAFTLLCSDIPGRPAATGGRGLAPPGERGGSAHGSNGSSNALARAAESAADLAARAAASVAYGHTVAAPDAGAHAHAIEAEWRRLYPSAEVKAVCVPHLPPVDAAFRDWRDSLARAREAATQEQQENDEMAHVDVASGGSLHAPLLPSHAKAVSLWRQRWTGAPLALEAARAAAAARARLQRAQAAALRGPSSTAFLIFRSRRAACTAVQALLHPNPLHWQLRAAPAPGEVHWNNLRLRWWERRVRGASSAAVSALVILFFLVPVSAISSLSAMERLKRVPLIRELEAALPGLVEGYLPGLALAVALALVPLAFAALARRQGCLSVSDADRQVASRVFAVLLLDVFLGGTVARAIVSLLLALSSLQWDVSLSDVLALLGTSVSNSAPLFIGFLTVRSLAGLPLELSRLSAMLASAWRAALQQPDAWAPGPLSYGTQVPNALLVTLLGLVYAPIAPVLLPCAACFFTLGCVVWRYQVLFVYTRVYESHGAWWPHMANRILASLAVGHATLAAVFALKLAGAVPVVGRRFSITVLAGPALIPLPLSIAVFARHYRRRFAPIFKRVPLSAAAEMGDAEDGFIFYSAYHAPCMRTPEELEATAPHLWTLPPPLDAIARAGEQEDEHEQEEARTTEDELPVSTIGGGLFDESDDGNAAGAAG